MATANENERRIISRRSIKSQKCFCHELGYRSILKHDGAMGLLGINIQHQDMSLMYASVGEVVTQWWETSVRLHPRPTWFVSTLY